MKLSTTFVHMLNSIVSSALLKHYVDSLNYIYGACTTTLHHMMGCFACILFKCTLFLAGGLNTFKVYVASSLCILFMPCVLLDLWEGKVVHTLY